MITALSLSDIFSKGRGIRREALHKIEKELNRFGEYELKGSFVFFNEKIDYKKIYNIPGVKKVYYGEIVENNLNTIKEKALDLFKSKNVKVFYIDAEKRGGLSSTLIKNEVGKYIKEKTNAIVSIKYGLKIGIISFDTFSFIYIDEFDGIGGLPSVFEKVLIVSDGSAESYISALLTARKGFYPVIFGEKLDLNFKHDFVDFNSRKYSSLIAMSRKELKDAIWLYILFNAAIYYAERKNIKYIAFPISISNNSFEDPRNIKYIIEKNSLIGILPLFSLTKSEIDRLINYYAKFLPRQEYYLNPETIGKIKEEKELLSLDLEIRSILSSLL